MYYTENIKLFKHMLVKFYLRVIAFFIINEYNILYKNINKKSNSEVSYAYQWLLKVEIVVSSEWENYKWYFKLSAY